MKIIAYHLDFKRAMWKRSYLDRFAERLKKWGYNTLVLEMEDKFRFSEHPVISHSEAWKHEETSAFTAKCRKMGMQVIPLMQSLGHLEFIVGKEEYAHLREAPELTTHVDVTNPDSIPFLIKLYDEIIDVVRPSQYFHMGGDETWQLGNSRRCGPLLRKHGRGGLYLRHMRPLWEHIHRRGLTPIIWADMALAHPDIIAKIPKYVALMDWNYWLTNERLNSILVWGGFGKGNRRLNREELRKEADLPFRRNLMKYAVDKQTGRDNSLCAFYCTDALIDRGFTVLTAPANRCAGDLVGIPISSRHVPNCYYFARKGIQDGAGMLVTSWAVRHNHPETDLPATYAATWGLKRKGTFDQAEFWKAYTADMYGAELPGLGDAVALAEKGAGISFLQAHVLQDLSHDLLMKAVAGFIKEQGGKPKARLYLENILNDYEKAAAMFKCFRKQARRNAGNLDFWLEGIAMDGLLLRLALAVLTKSLFREKNHLISALENLRCRTGEIFAGAYLPQSVKEELDIRYGFISRYLDV
jgi:hypothetical protein